MDNVSYQIVNHFLLFHFQLFVFRKPPFLVVSNSLGVYLLVIMQPDIRGNLVPGEVWEEATKAMKFPKFTEDLKPFIWKLKITAKRVRDQALWLADFSSRSSQVIYLLSNSSS